jgi:long-subunit acyl-CoA synthetase (AMP-forming)
MLDHWAATRPHEVYLRQPRAGVYHDFTWRQVQEQARRIAGALRHLRLAPGDKVALLSKNCAEWFVTDLAMMLGGYISVPIYPTANANTIRYVLENSGAKAIFVGKLDDWPGQEAGVGDDIPRLALPYDTMPAQYDWQQLLQLGQPVTDYDYPDPGRIMTLIYTSGSTGLPKGVVQTFASLSWAGYTVSRDLAGAQEDRVVSYLPLAHITERAYIEIASLYTGSVVGFVESPDTFIDDVKRGRPTFFISVPRLWTVFQEKILERVGATKLGLLLRIPFVRDIVKRRIRDGLGLAHARILGCGSAPVAPSLIEWYSRIGMKITEAWGMTENCAYATVQYPFDSAKIGSAGRPGIDCEVKVSDQGELLFRGPGLMTGYYEDPEATAAAFTEDGFFRTGDLCRIDADGYVFITGRVSDNFKTAKGKYVAPVPIEDELAKDPHIELSCVMGSGLPQPIALVQLTEEARSNPREHVRSDLKTTIDAVNSRLEPHSVLDAIVVVSEPWTSENDAMTPSLKLKRHVLEQRFNERVRGNRGGLVRWEDEL